MTIRRTLVLAGGLFMATSVISVALPARQLAVGGILGPLLAAAGLLAAALLPRFSHNVFGGDPTASGLVIALAAVTAASPLSGLAPDPVPVAAQVVAVVLAVLAALRITRLRTFHGSTRYVPLAVVACYVVITIVAYLALGGSVNATVGAASWAVAAFDLAYVGAIAAIACLCFFLAGQHDAGRSHAGE